MLNWAGFSGIDPVSMGAAAIAAKQGIKHSAQHAKRTTSMHAPEKASHKAQLHQMPASYFASQLAQVHFGAKNQKEAPSIPIVDISGLFANDNVGIKEKTAAFKLGQALTKKNGTGFVAVAMDAHEVGLTPEQLKAFSGQVQDFLSKGADYLNQFYEPKILQQVGYQPNKAEKLDYKEAFHLPILESSFNAMTKPYSGDREFQAFAQQVKTFMPAQKKVMNTLVRLFDVYFAPVFKEKGLPVDYFQQMMGFTTPDGEYVDDGNHLLRMIKYPELTDDTFLNTAVTTDQKETPVVEEDGVRKFVRASAHDDMGFLTIIPEPSVPGLEVKTRDGQWISTYDSLQKAPADGKMRFVVNSGNMFKDATKGLLPDYEMLSTIHRVVSTEDASTRQIRVALPLFVHPNHREPLMNIDKGTPVEMHIKKGPFVGTTINLGSKEGIFPFIAHQQFKRMNEYLEPIQEELVEYGETPSGEDQVKVFHDFYEMGINMPEGYFGPKRPEEQSVRELFDATKGSTGESINYISAS